MRLATYLCRKGTKRTGDEIGEVSLKTAQLNQIRFNRPRSHLFLINHTNSYVPSADTTSHPTAATAGPEKPPQKACLLLSADGRGIFPQLIPSRLRNWAPSPLRSRGSKARPQRVSTTAPGQQSQGQLWASPYMAEARASDRSGCPKSCPRPAGRSPNGIPP